jgi:DNA repair protein RecO (recombination protein O)
MEWDAPAIVLSARPYGEGGLITTVLTAEAGLHRGLARGGASRAQSGIWQAGNMVVARWVGRLSEQLGTLSAELVHPVAGLVIDDPLALAMLSAACALAEGALPEREPHPVVFGGLGQLLLDLSRGAPTMASLIRWEATLLAELGYGLDLARCAVTGETENLAFVSPKTGRAVSASAAGAWAERLLVLPPFLRDPSLADPGDPVAWRDGLRLTGHFLARDAFGLHHRPLPDARLRLYDRIEALAERVPETAPWPTT